jgi:hypothetical protein
VNGRQHGNDPGRYEPVDLFAPGDEVAPAAAGGEQIVTNPAGPGKAQCPTRDILPDHDARANPISCDGP